MSRVSGHRRFIKGEEKGEQDNGAKETWRFASEPDHLPK
jgi:hypothetical protein